jgi:hypothetical protein
VDAAATHLERDVANGKKTREFLGQSVGFENELIGQTNFPHQLSRESPSRAADFILTRQFSRTPWKSSRTAASGLEYAVIGTG